MKPRTSGIAALASMAVACVSAGCASQSVDPVTISANETCDSPEAVRAAFMYGYGVYEFARTQSEALTSGGQDMNRLLQRTKLSTPQDNAVTSPNIDTLYSTAFLDLSGGPVEVQTPEAPDRYHSIAFMNAFTDNIAYLGTRTTGGKAGRFWIVGPEWTGTSPDDITLVRADTNDVWMLGRTLVSGPDDLDAAKAVQAGISVSDTSTTEPRGRLETMPPRLPDTPVFLSVVNEMLGRSPVTSGQARRAHLFSACGIRPGDPDAWNDLSAEEQQVWKDELPLALDSLRRKTRRTDIKDGAWRGAPPDVGNFGENDTLRARIALSGLAALSAQEATYFVTARDSDGNVLDGNRNYTFNLPRGGVPVDAFWSLTMYAEDEEGRYFLVENPISRYNISGRTNDITTNEDGSMTIYLQAEMPEGEDAAANWLPAPRGPFSLSFRAYLPRADLLTGKWTPQPVQLADTN